MRLGHFLIASLCLFALLFCDLYDSRAWSVISDGNNPAQQSEIGINHIRLTGIDFIIGNMPDKLAKGDGPTLPHYRWGAIASVVILLMMISASIGLKQSRRAAWINLVLLGLFLIAFVQMENFKNPYFQYIANLKERPTTATIDTQMLMATKTISYTLQLLALANLVYLVAETFFRKKRVTAVVAG